MSPTDALARFRRFYDEFSAGSDARVDELYAPGFVFEDAFHAIRGDRAALRAYFARIPKMLAENRFVVEDTAIGDDGCYVRWRWEWRRRARDPLRTAPGVTHVRFDADGRIVYHRDLFDAASAFYETLPVVGSVLRAIKKRI